MKKFNVDTWLPVFSGFYDTIWASDSEEEMVLEHINAERGAKGLPDIAWEDVEFDYAEYEESICEQFTYSVVKDLQTLGLVADGQMQKINYPREYNFANDSVNAVFTLTQANMTAIKAYLGAHTSAFKKYLTSRYTSYDGFISHYSNNIEDWPATPETLTHTHKLGSVLQFILLNEDKEYEMTVYYDTEKLIYAKNYEALVNGKEKKRSLI